VWRDRVNQITTVYLAADSRMQALSALCRSRREKAISKKLFCNKEDYRLHGILGERRKPFQGAPPPG
jgi:hypothetical protein